VSINTSKTLKFIVFEKVSMTTHKFEKLAN
jgi:hypothetical protein